MQLVGARVTIVAIRVTIRLILVVFEAFSCLLIALHFLKAVVGVPSNLLVSFLPCRVHPRIPPLVHNIAARQDGHLTFYMTWCNQQLRLLNLMKQELEINLITDCPEASPFRNSCSGTCQPVPSRRAKTCRCLAASLCEHGNNRHEACYIQINEVLKNIINGRTSQGPRSTDIEKKKIAVRQAKVVHQCTYALSLTNYEN